MDSKYWLSVREGTSKPLASHPHPMVLGFFFFSSELTELLFSPFKLSEILKFGLDKLLSSEGSSVDEVDLESILGETKDGQWVPDALPAAAEGGHREQEEGSELETRSYSLSCILS